jgi:hypothetical protein
VFSLCKGQNGLLFIGTDGNGITPATKIRNSSTGPKFPGSEQCDYFKSVYSIYQDGFVWLGTNGYGMIRLK